MYVNTCLFIQSYSLRSPQVLSAAAGRPAYLQCVAIILQPPTLSDEQLFHQSDAATTGGVKTLQAEQVGLRDVPPVGVS